MCYPEDLLPHVKYLMEHETCLNEADINSLAQAEREIKRVVMRVYYRLRSEEEENLDRAFRAIDQAVGGSFTSLAPVMKPHNYNRSLPPNPYNPLAWIHPGAVIGENCWIGAFVYIGPGVEIGDNVSISNGVQIFDHDTSWYRVSEGRLPAKHYKVTIGRFTQVGSNTVIVPCDTDITIGDHCIIGALSLVKKNVPSYSVAVGVPARVIRHIDEDVINEKMRIK